MKEAIITATFKMPNAWDEVDVADMISTKINVH